MNIPDEVLDTAVIAWWQDYTDEENLDGMSAASAITLREAMNAAAPVIAEWARKEALREAAATAKRWSSPHTPYDSPAVLAILALAEGVRS